MLLVDLLGLCLYINREWLFKGYGLAILFGIALLSVVFISFSALIDINEYLKRHVEVGAKMQPLPLRKNNRGHWVVDEESRVQSFFLLGNLNPAMNIIMYGEDDSFGLVMFGCCSCAIEMLQFNRGRRIARREGSETGYLSTGSMPGDSDDSEEESEDSDGNSRRTPAWSRRSYGT